VDHVTVDHMTACAYMDSVTMHDDIIIAQFASCRWSLILVDNQVHEAAL